MQTLVLFAVACLAVLLSGCAVTDRPPLFSFGRGQWDPTEWTLVKTPRWDHFGGWVQRDTHIENQTPQGASPEATLGPRRSQTYTSMVLNRKFSGDVTVSSTMEFAHRMAPMIVVASDLGADAVGRAEHREHYEIVIYDEGVNVWRHSFRDGKPSWVKAADAQFELTPNVKHRLEVSIARSAEGKRMLVSVAGHELEYVDDSLPDEFYVGITGCEGVNRFYDFDVRPSAAPQ